MTAFGHPMMTLDSQVLFDLCGPASVRLSQRKMGASFACNDRRAFEFHSFEFPAGHAEACRLN